MLKRCASDPLAAAFCFGCAELLVNPINSEQCADYARFLGYFPYLLVYNATETPLPITVKTPVEPTVVTKLDAVDRALQALDKLYSLSSRLPDLMPPSSSPSSTSLAEKEWSSWWLPVLQTLSQQCLHPMRDIRQHAFALLQKALLHPRLSHPLEPYLSQSIAFHHIMFPLLAEFLSPQTNLDDNGKDESRMRACALLCRQFLQYLAAVCTDAPHLDANYWTTRPHQQRIMADLWAKVVDYLERYLQTSTSSNDFLVSFFCFHSNLHQSSH